MEELLNIDKDLKRYALSLTRDRDNAKDLLQETFLRVLSKGDNYQKEDIKPIAFTTMKNIFINNFKVRSRIVDEPYNEPTEEYTEDFLLVKELNRILDKLSLKYREPLVMYHKGYKYHEISEIKGIPLSTVKTRIRIGRAKLEELVSYKKLVSA